MPYEVCVGENWEAPHSQSWYRTALVDSRAEAFAVGCRVIDQSLAECYRQGMTSEELLSQYACFGESVIVCAIDAPELDFDSWRYAERRCVAVCAQRKGEGT